MAFVDGGISVDSSYAMIPISGDTAMIAPTHVLTGKRFLPVRSLVCKLMLARQL